MQNKEFQKLSLQEKYDHLKTHGEFLGSRMYSSYHVHLFSCNGYYVEMWKKLGINLIHSIDVVHSAKSLEAYTDNIQLPKL